MQGRVVLGVSLLVLVFAGLLLIWATNPSNNDNLPQNVISTRKVFGCEDFGFTKDCKMKSSVAQMPSKVQNMVKMIRDSSNSSKFSSYQYIDVNRVQYTSVKVGSEEGTYTINVFPDSVTYWFKKSGDAENTLTWADHDFDGKVDMGFYGDIVGNNPKRFDADFKVGIQYRPLYQMLYNHHFSIIAEKLGL